VSWGFIFALAGISYGFKLLGSVIIGQRVMPPVLERCLLLIPPALLAGLIAKDTFTVGQTIGIDARAAGLAVAALATWKKLPFAGIIVLGVGTTALIRVFA